jgi:hypothetical protein
MEDREMAEVFVLLRDRLTSVARNIVAKNLTEASFTIGCLHSICSQHAINLCKEVGEKDEQRT